MKKIFFKDLIVGDLLLYKAVSYSENTSSSVIGYMFILSNNVNDCKLCYLHNSNIRISKYVADDFVNIIYDVCIINIIYDVCIIREDQTLISPKFY